MLEVRWANEQDVADLLTVEEKCFTVYYYGQYKFGENDFRDYLGNARCIFLVAVLKSRPIGYVAGSIALSRTQGIAHVDSIGVRPKAQKKGVGSRLLRSFVREAQDRHCKVVMLEVATANEDGLAFFAKHQFREIRKLPDYYGEGVDGVLMIADI
ncbi:MAG: GNAT family N-acetyltransferase [Phycisphaerales bacterium]|nr:MAG: GNAT family N-acetyltransferase [Phycisphaerales bacterium]